MVFLLADNHSLIREGMAYILKAAFPDATIIHVDSWHDTHAKISNLKLDLAFIDLAMPGQASWDEELQRVRTAMPTLPICVISASNAQSDQRKVHEMGVAGFFHKSMNAMEFQQSIRRLCAEKRFFPQIQEPSPPSPSPSPSPLTTRQRNIMHLLANGYSNKMIARELQLSEGTVKRHFTNIFSVLHARNRVDALRIMREKNW